ncbi:MAG: hypothetical protein QXU98_07890, partial [Candidatus Parvarchaeota archaeon]
IKKEEIDKTLEWLKSKKCDYPLININYIEFDLRHCTVKTDDSFITVLFENTHIPLAYIFYEEITYLNSTCSYKK